MTRVPDELEALLESAEEAYRTALGGEAACTIHRDGRVSSTLKGNLWKGPFHLPRMQLMCWQMLNQAKQTAKSRR